MTPFRKREFKSFSLNRSLRLAILFGAVVLAALLIMHFRKDSGHSYAGKSLAYWCDQLPPTVQMPVAGFTCMGRIQDQAQEAISSLGTNCLPVLLSRLQAEYSPIQFGMRKALAKFRVIRPSEVGQRQNRREQALTGIVLLGRKADAILPEIANLKRSGDPWLSSAAGYLATQIKASKETGENLQTGR